MADTRDAVIAVAVIGAAIIASSGTEPPPGSPGPPQMTPESIIPPNPPLPAPRPSVFLSRDSGPAGTLVLVSGEGFAPGERVRLRFRIEQIGSTTADDAGKFSNVAVTIPDTFSRFARRQFMVVAIGESSSRRNSVPFTITD